MHLLSTLLSIKWNLVARREWMLVDAYDAANQGNYTLVHELQDVFGEPFEEQSADTTARFYRRRPDCADGRPGTAFMS